MTIQAYDYLDSKKIDYRKETFSTEIEKGAMNVAKALHMNPRSVVKTLVFTTKEGENVLVMVGGDQIGKSSLLKKAIGSKNIKLTDIKKVPEITGGFEVGAIPAVGWQADGFRSFIEESLMKEEILGVGTGHWGNEILITPENLVKAIDNLEVVKLVETVKDDKRGRSDVTHHVENNKDFPNLNPENKINQIDLLPKKERTSIADIKNHVDQEITLQGWVYNKRSSGKISFIQLRDGTGFIQVVAEQSSLGEETWKEIEKLTIESSVQVSGVVTKHPKKAETYELQLKDIKIIQLAPEFPIGKKEHGPEFLFDNRDLYLRSKTPWAVLRIRDQVFRSITDFFFEEQFIRLDSPILQPTSCEDTSQLFEVDYYEELMYLTQSGQLYSEAGIMGLGKVYDFGPVFRAEKSKTRNHLSEFWMMDAEMAFYDQDMNMDLQERLVKRILKDAIENCQTEVEILERDTTVIQRCIDEPFKRIFHIDAKKELEKDGFKVDFEDDMTTEEELHLGDKYGVPVFIMNYPFRVKSFYMKSRDEDSDIKRAVCSDLIAPEGAREIIGGSQREDDYDVLLAAMKERDYPLHEYEWYLNIRKYGSVPHSGFGIGLERTVRWITGIHHIRETVPFPRTVVRSRP